MYKRVDGPDAGNLLAHQGRPLPQRVSDRRAVTPSPEASLARKTLLLPFSFAYVAALLAGCAQTPGPGLARGEQIYGTCVPCHGKEGTGNASLGAPSIAGLPQWYLERQLNNFRSAMRGANPHDLEGSRMRPMARSLYREGDVTSVAEYVATKLKGHIPKATLAAGDTANGRARYQSICVTCHLDDGKGSEALGAPPLTYQHDWYMMSQISKFKSGMRGAHPEDVMGMQMAAMANTLEDTTAMHDVIAFIRTLQK